MNAIRCGLIGYPVAHSRSSEIHRSFAEQTGIALDYVLIDAAPEEFAVAVRHFFEAGGRGLNVTLPHKAAAYALADEAGSEATRSRVANVLTRLPDGRLHADNTDGIGLVRDLTENLDFHLAARRVLIAGAGGAAAGIIPTLLDNGAHEIVIVNRTPERAEALAAQTDDRRLAAKSPAKLGKERTFDLVINATNASLKGEQPQLPKSVIGNKTLAYDLAYTKQATPFMRWAAKLDARTADGYGMLVEQAAESFIIWNKIPPDSKPLLGKGIRSP